MSNQIKWETFDFSSLATYRILIKGNLPDHYSTRLGGMHIESPKGSFNPVITSLKGELCDQAALAGVLNDLYELRFPIISVQMISN